MKNEAIPGYDGEIILRLISINGSYRYEYSTNGGEKFNLFAETADNIVLCYGYIGVNMGIYATSNGYATKEYADFDWVAYKGFTRQ